MPFLVGVHSSLMPVGTLHVSCPELSWNAVVFFFHCHIFQIHHHHHHHNWSTVSLLIHLAQPSVLVRTMSSSETECLLESIHSWS